MRDRKVLLIRPSNRKLYETDNPRRDEPLGLEYLASSLQNGDKVKILDLDILNLTTDELREYLIAEGPDYVGITASTPMLVDAKQILGLVKEILPDCKKIIGGAHASSLPLNALQESGADVAVIGEGEESFKEILQGRPYGKIAGIAFKENTESVINPPRRIINDLDSLAQPAHHLVSRDSYRMSPYFEAYFKDGQRPIRSASVMTSRSCPFNCIYCASRKIFNAKVRLRSPENVIEELASLYFELGVKAIMFLDDVFTLDKERTIQICQRLIKSRINIKWWIDTRVDLISEGLLMLMKESGCRFIVYGVESGSQRILDMLKKGITVEQVKEAFAMTHRVGIDTKANFMLGHLDETEEEVMQSIKLAKELNPARAGFYLTLPVPGSELYEIAQKRKLINKDFSQFMWYHLPVANLSKIDNVKLKALQRYAYSQMQP
jgi:anaerobic magnesium-protoporphyrin IX monomethyl ester cyclase